MRKPYWNKAWPLKRRSIPAGAILYGLLVVTGLFACPVWGADRLSSENGESDIHISADRLIARSQSNYAEFIGNVHAVNDEVDITADILKVFYEQALENSSAKHSGSDIATGKTVRKIIATGNVTIKFNGKTAFTNNAVYSRQTGKIVMTGADSRVSDESGYISGEKITLHTETEQVTVESGNTNRVEAFINSTPADSKPTGGQMPGQDS